MHRALRRSWFERTFEVGLSLESHGDTVERLRGTPGRLQERVIDVSSGRLVGRSGDSWSIQEHVGHLRDLEPLWLGRVEDLLAGHDRLRSADLENRATWDAQHNQGSLDVLLGEFRAQRSELVRLVESLSREDLLVTALHPRLEQPMTVVDLCFFVAEHDDHHLATITVLRAGSQAVGPSE